MAISYPTGIKSLRFAMLMATGLFLGGCSYVVTERANECNVNMGVPYYLPKKLGKVTVTEAEEGQYVAHLSELPPIADPNQFYVAIPRQNFFRSRVIDIRTSPDGLLSSAFVTGEKRNANISDNVRLNTVFFNKEGLKDELNRGLHYQEDAKVAAVAGKEAGIIAFEGAFDPASPEDIESINCNLKKYKMQMEVGCLPEGAETPSVDRVSGLLIRPAVMRPVYVRSTSKDGKTVAALEGTVTKNAPLFNLPIQGGLFAKYSHNLELREGVLTGYYTRRPSEIHGIFQAATELVEDIASVPAAAIAPIAAAMEIARPASSQGGGESPAGGPERSEADVAVAEANAEAAAVAQDEAESNIKKGGMAVGAAMLTADAAPGSKRKPVTEEPQELPVVEVAKSKKSTKQEAAAADIALPVRPASKPETIVATSDSLAEPALPAPAPADSAELVSAEPRRGLLSRFKNAFPRNRQQQTPENPAAAQSAESVPVTASTPAPAIATALTPEEASGPGRVSTGFGSLFQGFRKKMPAGQNDATQPAVPSEPSLSAPPVQPIPADGTISATGVDTAKNETHRS